MLQVLPAGVLAANDLLVNGQKSTTAKVSKFVGRRVAPVYTYAVEKAVKDPKKAVKTLAKICAPITTSIVKDVKKNGLKKTATKVAKFFCPILNLF